MSRGHPRGCGRTPASAPASPWSSNAVGRRSRTMRFTSLADASTSSARRSSSETSSTLPTGAPQPAHDGAQPHRYPGQRRADAVVEVTAPADAVPLLWQFTTLRRDRRNSLVSRTRPTASVRCGTTSARTSRSRLPKVCSPAADHEPAHDLITQLPCGELSSCSPGSPRSATRVQSFASFVADIRSMATWSSRSASSDGGRATRAASRSRRSP